MMTDKSNMVDITLNKDVLVVGAGSVGLETASKIASQGYKVSVIGQKTACARQSGCTDEMLNSGTVNIMQDVVLEDVAGVTGDFRVTLAKGEEKMKAVFGAVVVAPNYSYASLNGAYGLALSDRVMSQSQFEAFMDSDGLKKVAADSGSDADDVENVIVAFLTGFGQEGDPVSTGRALKSALAVQKTSGCKAYIYTGNIKVGAKGLERIFTEGRHAGVVCFKPSVMPEIEQNSDSVKISITDPVVRSTIELEPDYVVVEEALVVGQDNLDTATLLRIDTDLDGLLPSNNVHRFPVRSNRDGIFVASNSVDAANVALRIAELIGDGIKNVSADQAKVDEERCVICLTCYRSCPHGAIFWENGAAAISPAACQGCGICASECPMDAIQLGDFTDESLRKSVKDAVVSVEGSPSIVAFCCKNSALEAGEAAARFGHNMPAGFKMVKVPCAGKVDVEFIMKAFVEGADGVMVAACHEGNCKAERGNTYAKWRVNEIQKRLENMGLGKDCLCFTTIASNMAGEFAAKVNAFADKLA
ncbi:putative fusion protein, heterodisulfide reductase (HdrA) / F420-non-reducing hydrogenase (MvhD) [Desulfamplus magnetovallimortis]|uniref:Putative fusion protein, heterodisulfide reductase (HdrA) / F420-non-reducing hydrogenase (MvhD) n=1 Tax=Desulfamplus magnetovallimortis TaxID=1246637 RepID=A0A1W1H523_9BACT|nr:hydrogenase iron-sulfur subunit [Desulfamplus magnetovallimortis]SLM27580.1 putative fusion protein, heterodisulfide reductase (HdrA) / F420-non-reducing hydrogenase (MvhD) [Desulfamplus magnetovallimortis]